MNRIRPGEALVILALILALTAFFYRQTQYHTLQKVRTETRQTLAEIQETTTLQRIWDHRDLPKKLERLKAQVPARALKQFVLKHQSLDVTIDGIDGKHLNRFLGGLGALPVQIVSLQIRRSGNNYHLECRCKW